MIEITAVCKIKHFNPYLLLQYFFMQIISIVQVLNVVLDQSPERKIAVAAINNGKIFHFIFFLHIDTFG